jgi:hypothetical protein
MTMPAAAEQHTDPRRRSLKPERITVGGVTYVRNDVLAAEQGVSERSVNRGDKDGAPYRFFGGVKYRPEQAYGQYVLKSVRTQPKTIKRRR